MKKKTARECRPCTGCCDGWVQMLIEDVEVYPGRPCPHSTGQGCDDYANRPVDPCVNFKCGWIIENSPLPQWLKPNEAKVIVLFGKLDWHGVPVDMAVPMGKRIPPRALNWLMKFAEEHNRPLIYSEQIAENGKLQKKQDYIGYGPPAFQEEVAELREKAIELWSVY